MLLGINLIFLCLLGAVIAEVNETDDGIDDYAEELPYTEGLFEGDLKLSKEMIAKFYNLSSLPGGEELLAEYADQIDNKNDTKDQNTREVRAVGSTTGINLWLGNIVRYRIHSTVISSTRNVISQAIAQWQANTCLRFVLATSQTRDYINFTTSSRGCYSDSIGRKGGRQIINLGRGCETVGITIHEIGHALGFWHEQARPDRDRYVSVNLNNVQSGFGHNFLRRRDFDIDNQGSHYDYGSIMHYRTRSFSRRGCFGSRCVTLSVTNTTEYARQGRPTIGQRIRLSAQDILQANRLYSCRCQSNAGIQGNLTIYVRRGVNLLDTDRGSNLPDPYVRVTGVDCSGNQVVRTTRHISNNRYPSWNQWLVMGVRRWQFFRISVWDNDFGLSRSSDDQLTMSQTVSVSSSRRINQRHCQNTTCRSYIYFDHGVSTNSTVTPIRNSRLQVKIKSARNLRDTDPNTNLPDPLVRVEAIQSTGRRTTMSTRYLYNTLSPTWNQWLNFSCQPYTSFTIQIFDYDFPALQALSNKHTFTAQTGYYRNRILPGYGLGQLYYDYQLVADGNECSSNPCLNGGRCIDGCASYTCLCPTGYVGTNCQLSNQCTLNVTARYGRGLLNRDGFYGTSDPYMRFTGNYRIGTRNYYLRRSTNYRINTRNPTWNQTISLGSRSWTRLQVTVYDKDFYGGDDALSRLRSFSVYQGVRRTGVRFSGYSGYVKFDYSCL